MSHHENFTLGNLPRDFLTRSLRYDMARKQEGLAFFLRDDIDPRYLGTNRSLYDELRGDQPSSLELAKLAGLTHVVVDPGVQMTEEELRTTIESLPEGAAVDPKQFVPQYRYQGVATIQMKNGERWLAEGDDTGGVIFSRLDKDSRKTGDQICVNKFNEVTKTVEGNIVAVDFTKKI